jgi:DNA polymerase-3 subunit delta
VGEVESAVNRFRDSVQTVSMFGGRRLVWLKDVNFLADTVTGRAESTLRSGG